MQKPHIFFRGGFFYPVEGIKDDAECSKHIALNPGTTRVETFDGRVVWKDGDPLPKRMDH